MCNVQMIAAPCSLKAKSLKTTPMGTPHILYEDRGGGEETPNDGSNFGSTGGHVLSMTSSHTVCLRFSYIAIAVSNSPLLVTGWCLMMCILDVLNAHFPSDDPSNGFELTHKETMVHWIPLWNCEIFLSYTPSAGLVGDVFNLMNFCLMVLQ